MTARAPLQAASTPACSDAAPEAAQQVLFASMRLAECKPPWRLPAQRAAAMVYGAARVEPKQVLLGRSSQADWEQALARRLESSRRDGPRQVLLYIHGYRNTAEAALARAQAIAATSDFNGPVVAFLWPSYNSTVRYTWDANENLWAMRQARGLLKRLATQADEVVLVAHSMGNRIALDALDHLERSNKDTAAKVTRLILASPDVDAGIFGEDLNQVAPGRDVTVYASARDRALRASRTVHGRRRAGDLRCWKRRQTESEPCPFAAAEKLVKIVDTGHFNNSVFGHDNFIETDEVAADMCRVIRGQPLYRKPIEGNLSRPDPDSAPPGEFCRGLQEDLKDRARVARGSHSSRRRLTSEP